MFTKEDKSIPQDNHNFLKLAFVGIFLRINRQKMNE